MRTRTSLVFTLLLAWALRLSIYITWRNWGEPEDERRRAHQVGVAWLTLTPTFSKTLPRIRRISPPPMAGARFTVIDEPQWATHRRDSFFHARSPPAVQRHRARFPARCHVPD
ncbi:MAG: DUF1295 domain-containing protein [Gammaproteobacteria bacterium]|nr:DUF1295 domain-containing protein [Gammaproteobacteria bacterium]